MSEPATSPSARFELLDALRGAAALGVLFFHVGAKGGPDWAPHGYLAVDLFFALSGFVIAHAYQARLASGMRPPAFLAARLGRLYPLYAIGLLIGATALMLVLPATADRDIAMAQALATALLFIPALGLPALFPLNPVMWSLFLEVAVNAAYGGLWRWITTRRLAAWVMLSGAGLAACALTGGGLNGGEGGDTLLTGLARVSFSFPLGLLVHRLHRTGRLPDLRALAPAAIPVCVAGLAAPLAGSANGMLDLALATLVWPLILVAGLQAQVGRWGRACAALGALSYPLYAVHLPVLILVGWAAKQAGLAHGALFAVPAALAVAWLAQRLDAAIRRGVGELRSTARLQSISLRVR